jgi:cell division protein FtsB
VLARLTPYLTTVGLAALIFYFGYQALTGDRGLLSSNQRGRALAEKTQALKIVAGQRKELEKRAQLLRDSSLSADLLEERAHSLLGYIDPRDYVIRADR